MYVLYVGIWLMRGYNMRENCKECDRVHYLNIAELVTVVNNHIMNGNEDWTLYNILTLWNHIPGPVKGTKSTLHYQCRGMRHQSLTCSVWDYFQFVNKNTNQWHDHSQKLGN